MSKEGVSFFFTLNDEVLILVNDFYGVALETLVFVACKYICCIYFSSLFIRSVYVDIFAHTNIICRPSQKNKIFAKRVKFENSL